MMSKPSEIRQLRGAPLAEASMIPSACTSIRESWSCAARCSRALVIAGRVDQFAIFASMCL
jgi:hypothetical protein